MKKRSELLPSQSALPGRSAPIAGAAKHFVNAMRSSPLSAGMQRAVCRHGLFLGARAACSGDPRRVLDPSATRAAENEESEIRGSLFGATTTLKWCRCVRSEKADVYDQLPRSFWEGHDPTQGMRQGNDAGTQYRVGHLTYGRKAVESRAFPRDRFHGIPPLKKASTRNQHRDPQAPEFYTQRIITSSTSPRIQRGLLAGLGGTGGVLVPGSGWAKA